MDYIQDNNLLSPNTPVLNFHDSIDRSNTFGIEDKEGNNFIRKKTSNMNIIRHVDKKSTRMVNNFNMLVNHFVKASNYSSSLVGTGDDFKFQNDPKENKKEFSIDFWRE